MGLIWPARQRHLQPGASEHDHGEEIVQVSEAVGHPHDDLDLVVHRFYPGVGKPVLCGRDDGIEMPRDLLLQLHELGNAAPPCPAPPFLDGAADLVGR